MGAAQSYYAATANPYTRHPSLGTDDKADLCIVGGGATGLSAALHAAKRGLDVVLLEAETIGWGASGRNGGQIIPGLRKGAAELVDLYGAERARQLFSLGLDARDLVVDLVQGRGIACDLKLSGHITAAARPRDLPALADELRCLEHIMGYSHAGLVGAEALAAELGTARYHGGLIDRQGGHLHPLNFTYGLAEAARAAGARLFEGSPVIGIEPQASGVSIGTKGGTVRARYAVLACDALLGRLEPRLARRIAPIASYIAATEPLAEADWLMTQDRAVSDTKFVVNYFRMSADRRLLFGGGERYRATEPRDIAAFVRPHLTRVFPRLADIRIDYGWGGLVSVTTTRMPHAGRFGPILFAHGYSGQGVALSVLAGRSLAAAITGAPEELDLLASVAPPPFPGGPALRRPLSTLGLMWFALRDRL